MRNYYFILGNGFTLDFLSHLNKLEEIDVINLFSQGDQVPYPADKEPGFLSYKRCPNLWNLGARAFMDKKPSIELIEDIITCANIASSAKDRHLDSTYIQAYQELSTYLKYLFIHYNKKILDSDIKGRLESWGWFKLFKKLNESAQCSSVTIVTYNYDIWLERIFMNHDINFEICGITNGKYNVDKPCKFKIIKPHGSISFSYGDPIDPNRFKITSTQRELTNGQLTDYIVNYDSLDQVYMFNAIIPPAGDSMRLASDDNWADSLRKIAVDEAGKVNYSGEFIICGISYWHVDRLELDSILTSINPDVNVKVINPNPSNTLSAVLNSLFKNSIIYKNSNVLGDLYNE